VQLARFPVPLPFDHPAYRLELPLPDLLCQLDPADRHRRRRETLQACSIMLFRYLLDRTWHPFWQLATIL